MTGFTLIELVTVIAIAAILVAVAAPAFTNFTAQQRVKATAGDLYLVMSKARSEAIKRNTNITVQPVSAGSGWQGGWGIWDPVNNVYMDTHGAASGITVTTGAASVVYQGSGRVQGGAALQFQVSSSLGSTTPRCVRLDPSGRPYSKTSAC